ncbi:MAG: hypothetical protein IPJ37_23790 [Bacteroidales bacterium]|nr:hypothetical protein [Bacteroidales bacterium]
MACAQKENLNPSPQINTFDQLISEFSDPTSEYRPAPFWVWNKDVTRSDIDRTLHEYKEEGFGGVFLHPRYGLITEYLSPEWFDLVKYSTEAAKKLDLQLWIYDENSYPSGFAGGHVNEQMPESYDQGVRLVPYQMDTLTIDKNLRVKYVFKKVEGNWKDITSAEKVEIGSSGQYMVLALQDFNKSAWYAGYSYTDLLVKGVTQKFIDITFPGYKNSVGDEFGKTIKGIFSDEPHTNTDVEGTIRWTPDLASSFRELHGYDLEPDMISLIDETGNWMKIRHDYHATILDMFIRRWSLPMSAYCEENNLSWTGHYWEHAWPDPSEGPDNMAMYEYHQVPAIDLLYNSQEIRPDQFGNIRVVKELSSAVNQFGQARALCEMYGGSGWEFTFEEMKRNGDWAYVLGVNLLNQHLSYMSLSGDRKFDYPPAFGPYAPYWKKYHYQNDYFGRLSVALSSGKQKNRILILEPTTTAWMYYSPDTNKVNNRFKEINPAFRSLLDLLEKSQVEYDLGSEHIIRDHGKITGQTFCINQCSYDLVIVPDFMDNFEESTYLLLKKYVSNGGRVMQLGDGVRYINAEPSAKLADLVSEKSWLKYPFLTREIIETSLTDPDFSVRVTRSGQLYHHRRRMDDGELIFFSNFSTDSSSVADVIIKGASVEELSAETGKELPVAYQKSGDKVLFQIKPGPSGSCLVYVFNDKVVNQAPAAKEEEAKPVSGSLTVISPSGPNILNLDYLRMKIGTGQETEMYFKHACDSIFRYFGFRNGNPWFRSSQFRTEILDRQKDYKKGDRFEVSYDFTIGQDVILKGMKLVVERPWLYTVSLNGTVIQPENGETWLDPDFYQFDIEKQLRQGNNTVSLVADPFSVNCETEPVYILGNFGLEPAEHGWEIVAPKNLTFGSWKGQGMPFYGQSVKYSKILNTNKKGRFRIELPSWSGTVASVNINGKEVGIIQTKSSYLTTELTQGENIIDIFVTGSLKNTLGPHHVLYPHGVGGRPANFIKAPEKQPGGASYSLLDYGLMQDFRVSAIE